MVDVGDNQTIQQSKSGKILCLDLHSTCVEEPENTAIVVLILLHVLLRLSLPLSETD